MSHADFMSLSALVADCVNDSLSVIPGGTVAREMVILGSKKEAV